MRTRRQPKRQKRKQGRPQKDTPAVGPESLIAATRELVKTIPPGQITRLDIARAAGVDPALIRYYFGNREALLVAAVLEAGAQMRDRLRRQDSAVGIPAVDKIRRRMVALLEVLYEDPSLHHLIIERIIHNYSKQAREFRHDLVFGACDNLASIIEEGVASGELRRVDPRHLFLAMIGACSFPMAERALFEELMGKEASRKHLDAYAQFVSELFINGLAGPAARGKRGLERQLESAKT